jgi:hypothetical protein
MQTCAVVGEKLLVWWSGGLPALLAVSGIEGGGVDCLTRGLQKSLSIVNHLPFFAVFSLAFKRDAENTHVPTDQWSKTRVG